MASASDCWFSWHPGAAGVLAVPSLRLRVSESSSLSDWSFPFRVALYASAVGFADALWLCPERALRRLFASVSLLAPGALSPLLHRVFPDGFRHWCPFHICGWASPIEFGPVGALGESRWLHLYRLTPDLVGLSHFCRVPLLLRSVFYVLLCDIPPVFTAIIWSVSRTPACPLHITPIRGCSLDTCVACDWLDLLSSSSLFQDFVICADLWSRQSGPDASCDRHSVALALSPSIQVVMTPCYCGMLGGLHGALKLG